MRYYFRNKTTLILSFVVAFCFFIGLTSIIYSGLGSATESVDNEPSVQNDILISDVKTETSSESLANVENVLIETDLSIKPESVNLFSSPPSEQHIKVEREGIFWIEFIDVGQGDSALIQCDGHYMLIDGGPPSASSVVYTILKNKKIDKLDYMIATHPDADHIGGLSGALNYASVGVCYSPVISHDTKTFASLVKYLNKQNVSITVPTAGTEFQLGSARVELLGPIQENTDTNNNSIVSRITFGETSFLFMGDAEYEEEKSLIEAGVDLSCDVLKAGHHGSSSSTSEAFLRKTTPQYVVLSVGTDNSYGHPSDKTLSKLKEYKLQLYRTDLQGDIICECDGKEISFLTEKKASEETLWIAGSTSDTSETRDDVVVTSAESVAIPDGTKYVLNTSSKRFHLTTCESVNDISDGNRAYSTDSAENLIAVGYKPCGRCNPYDAKMHDDSSHEDKETQNTTEKGAYVLNTKKMKFHKPDCPEVIDIKSKYRKKVTMSRKKIIKKGYKPCKSCNP